jgi:hypothetical protein
LRAERPRKVRDAQAAWLYVQGSGGAGGWQGKCCGDDEKVAYISAAKADSTTKFYSACINEITLPALGWIDVLVLVLLIIAAAIVIYLLWPVIFGSLP